MIIRKWEPFRDFIEKFFDEDIFPIKVASMATDVYETDKDVIVEINVPGFKKEDIKISLQDNYLKVEGRIDEEKEDKNKNYWRKEIKKGSFVRVIPLPREVDVKKAKANLKDGVLKVTLPKLEETKDFGEEIKIE